MMKNGVFSDRKCWAFWIRWLCKSICK